MAIPLEDQWTDVLGKARRGLRLSESQLAQKAGLAPAAVEAIQAGRLPDGDALRRAADALGLDAPALEEIADGSWHPGDLALPPTLAAFNAPFGDMTVNFYLAWDRPGGRAAAFDTGGDCAPILEALRANGLTLDAIFLTHTHTDHVADLDRLVSVTGAPVYVSGLERVPRTESIEDGRSFTIGGMTISARLTPGHSPGGMTYVVEGFEPGLAVVGDALFAGSMGGVAPEAYAAALRANREKILALPGETIICPGHGPLTTVALEKEHNPFYAAGAK